MVRNDKMVAFFTYAAFAVIMLANDSAFATGLPTPPIPPAIAPDHCAAGTLGGMMCNILASTTRLPGLVSGASYVMGLICGFMGIMNLKELVEGGHHHKVTMWDPIKRFTAGGMFFALPIVVDAVLSTIIGTGGAHYTGTTGFVTTSLPSAGLDKMFLRLVGNVMEPIIWLTGFFGWVAGLIFVFIGISRLMKSEQDGHRGPTGIGTVMTFLVAGALFSLNSIVTFLNGSIFGPGNIKTNAALVYTSGLGGAHVHVEAVFGGILAFSIILGWISIARGLFMVRAVSEGNQQASMMAAITHLIGGALAINLGGFISAVQDTLGITSYGFVFF